jgi:hypothetical protein
MAEWGDTAEGYLSRVGHLSGSLAGGANGAFLLNAATMRRDASIDQLFGAAGSDWFLFAGAGRFLDQVRDASPGEVLSGL